MPVFTQQPNSSDPLAKNSVNTKSIQLYNGESQIFPSTMQLGYWNDVFLTVGINPAKPKELQTEKERYDYTQTIRAAIPALKAIELLDNFDRIVTAFREGKSANCYIDIAGNNLAGYGTMKRNDGKSIFYVGIHRNLNDNRVPGQSAYYEFNFNHAINNYEPRDGKYEMSQSELGEFLMWKYFLDEGIRSVTRATAHSIRVANDWYYRRMEGKLEAIARSTKADISGFGAPSSLSMSRSRLFNNPGNADTATMQNVIKEAEEALAGKPAENTVSNELPNMEEVPF